MRKTPLIIAAALAVVATGCRDYDFTADGKADYVVASDDGTWTT